jgi:phage-related protein
MREIYFYRTASGDCPVEVFLAGLGPKQAQKVAWVLRAVKALPLVPLQYFKKLEGTEDIWEVRADFGGDAFRLLGFWDAGRLIILTNAFSKKTQKTPEREIALAEQRKRDYLNRKKKP